MLLRVQSEQKGCINDHLVVVVVNYKDQ